MESPLAIYFIRHGKLDLPYRSHLEMPYEILAGLSSGQLDPGIAPASRELFLATTGSLLPLESVDVIYYNNSDKQARRSQESADLIRKIIEEKTKKTIPLVGNRDVKEVDFELPKILSKEEFSKQGMPAIRTALYRAEIEGKVVESIVDIYARIRRIFELMKAHEAKNEVVLIVAHDFFMRVIEVYCTVSKDCREVTVDDLEKTRLSTYFRGFGVSYNLNRFEFI